MKPLLTQLFSLFVIIQIMACDKLPSSANEVPIAFAGLAQTVDEQTLVTLNGSGNDVDGSIVSYVWSQTAGESVLLNSPNAVTTTFDSPVTLMTLTLTFKLTVTDDKGATATDSVTVTVEPINITPVVNAGHDQTVDEQVTVTLSAANSLDTDGSITGYLWEQITGETVVLSNPNTIEATFESPQTDRSVQLGFQLTVTDNENVAATDSVVVTVNHVNLAPFANAGDNQMVNEQSNISLQGQGNDPENDVLGYQWVQTDGEQVEITNSNQAVASFVSPATINQINLAFELTVTDVQGLSNIDSVMIDVTPVISGQVVDDILVNATVSLLTFPEQQLIIQTQTNSSGLYTIQQNNLSESFVLEVTGGTFNDENGEAFVGKLTAFCLREERLSCHATPMTTLVLEYAVANGLFTQGNKAEWLAVIANSLDIDLTTEPFVENSQTNINLAKIRTYLQNGSQLNQWIIEVLNFINTGASSTDFYDWFPAANTAPLAYAGDDQNVDEQVSVTLNGSASSDNDGSIVSYQWLQTSGTSVTLSDASSVSATFTSPILTVQTSLTFSLTVTDNEGASNTDNLTIIVIPVNAAPIAQAGSDVIINRAIQTGTLDGSGSSDSDGIIVNYQWVETTSSGVSLINANTSTATFTAPPVANGTVLTFELTVTDNEGGTHTDSLNTTIISNTPPIANAGNSQFVVSGNIINLDASATSDAETINNDLVFNWSRTDSTGIVITLNDANIEQPSFTAPILMAAETVTFEVTVTDADGFIDSAETSVAIQPVITQLINDTGVNLCADYAYGAGSNNHSSSEDCADVIDGDGDPIPDWQDADFGRDITANDNADGESGFSFTKLDANGNPLPQSAVIWSCVLDNVTKLIWEVKSANIGLQSMNNTYSWHSTNTSTNGGHSGTQNGGSCDGSDCDTQGYVTAINAGNGLCGANDWRMPNRETLRSILNYSKKNSTGPLIDPNFFPNTGNDKYWSYSTVPSVTSTAWFIFFNIGSDLSSSKGDNYRVRLVRAGQ